MTPLQSAELKIDDNVIGVFSRRTVAYVSVICFSILYFVETIIRASDKRFWFDELATYYICRLPTFHDSWTAVLHGADYNPPFFYLIERASMAIFGDGLVGVRLPQIVAFWILCLCLFGVVSRCAGTWAGLTAMAFPMITGAYYYAYEARPHGIVLGLAGLSLFCWDRLESRRNSVFWLAAFALSLQAAFLTHCYAVLIVIPFALVEVVRTIQSKKLDWRKWLALTLPAVIAAISFIPLLRSYRSSFQRTGHNSVMPANSGQISSFYLEMLRPCVLALVIVLILFALQRRFGNSSREHSRALGWHLFLSVAFLAMPLYGMLLANTIHGPFVARYFMSAAIGVCAVVGLGAGQRAKGRLDLLLPGIVGVLFVWNAERLASDYIHGIGEYITEPSTNNLLNTTPGDDLANHPLLRDSSSDLPVAIPDIHDLLYLVRYWPSQLARLFEVLPSRDTAAYLITQPVREWCHVQYNDVATYDEFFRTHRHFLLYGRPPFYFLLTRLIADGAQVRNLKFEGTEHFLAEIHLPDTNITVR